MKLTLSQQEIEQAVRGYVTGMISLQAGTDISIDFRAGRGENGITAEVDISYLAVAAIPEIAKPAVATKPISAFAAAAAAAPKAAPLVTNDVASDPVQDAKPAEDTPAEVRKTTGKSLFGGAKATVEEVAELAANDSDDTAEGTLPKAAATRGRKTLFSE